MILILEITSPQSTKLGGASRQTFNEDGGSIGREHDNSWVLPHSKVSGHHALISYRNAGFYVEDTSRNGVCLNSSRNRLVHGRPYALSAGDRILIDPYEIQVSIARDQNDASGQQFDELSDVRSSDLQFGASSPFEIEDPFAPRPIPSSGLEESIEGQEVDPLQLLNLAAPKRAPAAKTPRARDLDRGSILDEHFQPPDVLPAPAPPPAPMPRGNPVMIPQDYDPLAPDEPTSALPRPSAPPPPPRERPYERPHERSHERSQERPREPHQERPKEPVVNWPADDETEPLIVAPAPPPPRAVHSEPLGGLAPAGSSTDHSSSAEFAAVLAGAGLDPANVTSELARTFGQILRVVVSGVMDVMRSRQQIKDEFRMRMTRFRTAENNPLKFSANVDDALHNLLVKRNPAYLAPVEAFEDAFTDLRNHQIAMLAGMRVAFESMLAEFDPDRLQQDFDRQLGKGLMPSKLRYWDLFRERRNDIVKDPEASFRRLFGAEFARAYEEQLAQLKAKDGGAGRAAQKTPRPPDT